MFNISKEYLVIKVVPKIAKFQNVILKRTLETKLGLGRILFLPDTGYSTDHLCRIPGVDKISGRLPDNQILQKKTKICHKIFGAILYYTFGVGTLFLIYLKIRRVTFLFICFIILA